MKTLQLTFALFVATIIISSSVLAQDTSQSNTLQPAKLFAELPDKCPTPDAFDIAPDGSLTLSCPNYADASKPGILMRIDKNGTVSTIGEVPVLEQTGRAKPMGIAYAPNGKLFVCDNQNKEQGRLLCLSIENNKIVDSETVAYGFKSINGIRYHNNSVYVTQTALPKFKTKHLTSGVYCFNIADRNIKVNNDASDENLIYTSKTENPKRQFGLDGLVFNKAGHLFVGNLGDARIYKLTLKDNKVTHEEVYAQLPITAGPDGINIDDQGNLYVAGFLQNQIFKIDTKQKVSILAEYPDNDGSNGQIDQPADLIVYDNKLIISNFDLMVQEGVVNKAHGKPYTISYIDL